MDDIGIGFTIIFFLEAVIKILGLGIRYFKIGENIFDFVVSLISVGAIFVQFFEDKNFLGVTVVVRLFRIGRIFKLFRNLESIHLIFQAFMHSLPSLLNVGGLLLLLFFIYSVLSMNYFANVKFNGPMN